MSGVYISGMEMPKSCFDCPFCENIDPDTWACLVSGEKFTDRFFHRGHRDERCPLKEITEIDLGVYLEGSVKTFNIPKMEEQT